MIKAKISILVIILLIIIPIAIAEQNWYYDMEGGAGNPSVSVTQGSGLCTISATNKISGSYSLRCGVGGASEMSFTTLDDVNSTTGNYTATYQGKLISANAFGGIGFQHIAGGTYGTTFRHLIAGTITINDENLSTIATTSGGGGSTAYDFTNTWDFAGTYAKHSIDGGANTTSTNPVLFIENRNGTIGFHYYGNREVIFDNINITCWDCAGATPPAVFSITATNTDVDPEQENSTTEIELQITTTGHNVTAGGGATINYNGTNYVATQTELNTGTGGNVTYKVNITTPITLINNTIHYYTWNYNITINASDVHNNQTTNSQNLIWKYHRINATATNKWNGSNINDFNITINNITYSTNTGNILQIYATGTNNYTFNSENYFENTTEKTTTGLYTKINTTMYQVISNIRVKDIFNNNSVKNYTLTNENNISSTTNYVITIYPNADETYTNFSALEFYNVNNILLNYTGFGLTTKNYTIINVHTAEWTMQNNITNATINATCTYLGNTELTDKFSTYNQTNYTMDCTEFGYINDTFQINGSKLNATFKMQPVRLMITFSENTTGYIAWEGEVNGTNGFTFNDTQILLGQDEIGIGYVSIVFNDGQQLYEYYNDGNTHINQYLYVQSPDVIQPMKLWDGTQYIEGKITVFQLDNDTFRNIFTTFTNAEGEANVLLSSGNVFKFVGTSAGYDSATLIEYIPPTTATLNTEIIVLELSQSTSLIQQYTYNNTCANLVETPINCIITITSNINTYAFGFTYTSNWTNITSTQADSTSASIIIPVNENTTNNGTTPIWIYSDGTLVNVMTIKYADLSDKEIQIGFDEDDRSWILESRTTITMFFIVALFISVLIGVLINQLFEGTGAKAGVIALMLFGGEVFPILYGVALLFAIWIFYEWRKKN